MPKPTTDQAIRFAIDRCVKCGLCLAECPTYRLAGNENESPRGRLALIDGLLGGQVPADAALIGHIDRCLLCRRCERVCPSQVAYGEILDAARARLPRRASVLATWVRHPGLLAAATRVARALPLALTRPLPALHRLHRAATALPTGRAVPSPARTPAATPAGRPRVGLFVGCVGPSQQAGTIAATVEVLERCGFAVVQPSGAGCCGALAAHGGDAGRADRLAATNRAAFDDRLEAVVSIASGCGIHLAAYTPALAAPVYDITRFLLERAGFDGADLRPLAARVALHTPCSLENVFRGGDWPLRLLRLIPGLRVDPIGEPGQCCGAAGDYMLRHPADAARLRGPLLAKLGGGDFDILATSNIGCAMHLADGLRGTGRGIEILHPVELLARQLK